MLIWMYIYTLYIIVFYMLTLVGVISQGVVVGTWGCGIIIKLNIKCVSFTQLKWHQKTIGGIYNSPPHNDRVKIIYCYVYMFIICIFTLWDPIWNTKIILCLLINTLSMEIGVCV